MARTVCKRGVVLHRGRLVADAPSEEAIEAYDSLENPQAPASPAEAASV